LNHKVPALARRAGTDHASAGARGLRWLRFGNLNNGVGNAGLSCGNGNNGLGNANWNIGGRIFGNV
jgi:hypothetical protein